MFVIFFAAALLIAGGASANYLPEKMSPESFFPPGLDKLKNDQSRLHIETAISIISTLLTADPYIVEILDLEYTVLNIELCIKIQGLNVYGFSAIVIRNIDFQDGIIIFDIYIPRIQVSVSSIIIDATGYSYFFGSIQISGSIVLYDVCLQGQICYSLDNEIIFTEATINVSVGQSKSDLIVFVDSSNISIIVNQLVNKLSDILQLDIVSNIISNLFCALLGIV